METIKLGQNTYPLLTCHAVVVGTGAAGYNAALRLYDYGVRDVVMVTEGVRMGTSRNTGSDKQTYYKLNLCADYPDSPASMAEDFFQGKCVDGDHAYVEAALSAPSFLHLAELSVPFPVNRYGEYVGYKTDHDPRARATSAGPLTSKLMTECLERAVADRGIAVKDGWQLISLLKEGDRAVGLLCLDKNAPGTLVCIRSSNIVLCTGGPAGLYADTVYPPGHHGSTGVALEAGAKGKNLTEWQFGLASVAPRWNVSGTYMQVLPRVVSVDENGREYEFLDGEFPSFGAMLSALFQKGYEWPFDCRKVRTGSSYIDLLVYRETCLRGRTVYLDYRSNPRGLAELPYGELTEEARDYLTKAGALFGTPLERLAHMNRPAIDLYKGKGVDLSAEMLQIALCAQHNNGGLDVDLWWQTELPGLFAAGEVAGTHGVYRPGGSALNAGQCGSMRAAQYIAHHGIAPMEEEAFAAAAAATVERFAHLTAQMLQNPDNAKETLQKLQADMSRIGGALRDPAAICASLAGLQELYLRFAERVGASAETLPTAYRLRDALIGQICYLTAMADYARRGGGSRGSAMYTNPAGQAPRGFGEDFRFVLDSGEGDGTVQTVSFCNGVAEAATRPVRPLPQGGGFFENVWRRYREDGNIY